MLQSRMVFLYLLLVGLVVIGMLYIIQEERDDHLNNVLVPTLEAARLSHESLMVHRFDRLKEFAKEAENSDLVVYLSALSQMRKTVQEVSVKARESFIGRSGITEETVKEFVSAEAKVQIEAFMDFLRKNLKDIPEKKTTEDWVKLLQPKLVSCMAERSNPWDVCYFKFTFIPLFEVIFDKLSMGLRGEFPQLFILVDSDGQTSRLFIRNLAGELSKIRGGKGLDYDLESTRYASHQIKNLSRELPALEYLKGSEDSSTSTLFKFNDTLFLSVVQKLQNEKGDILGYLVVGLEVESGLARIDTRQVLGVRPKLTRCPQFGLMARSEKINPLPEQVCDFEAQFQSYGVTYLFRPGSGSIQKKGSSVGDSGSDEILRMVAKDPRLILVRGDNYIVSVADVPLEQPREGERLMAVLSLSLGSAGKFFERVDLAIIIAGGLIALIGSILLIWLLRASRKPFEEIDSAVHEIISGNFSHQVPFQFREALPRTLGQSLSVMKAVLLGEPLPEELETESTWSGGLIVAAEEETGKDTVSEDVPNLRIRYEDEIKETVTQYYKRIHGEFLTAKTRQGEPVDSITFNNFVEHLARTEKSLRSQLGCKAVRFEVEVKNGQVILVPIKILERG